MRITRTRLRKWWRARRLLGDEPFSPIFICGVAGCGNTVTAALLHERYEVAGFADESALYAPYRSPLRVASSQTFSSVARFRNSMALAPSVTNRAIRAAAMEVYRRECDELRSGGIIIDKAPNAHMVRARRLSEAFPDARFVMVYRDPLGHVEGMRRKWALFRRASLGEVCDFWRDLHQAFLSGCVGFNDRVFAYSYECFVADPDATLSTLATALGLPPREQSRMRQDRRNAEGFALRNVVGGQVEVVGDANARAVARLSRSDREHIDAALRPIYERMSREFPWPPDAAAVMGKGEPGGAGIAAS